MTRRPSTIGRGLLTALLAILLTSLLAACGTTDSDDSSADSGSEGTEADAGTSGRNASTDDGCDEDPAVSDEPVSVTDAHGRTVELDAPAERVAVLEWQQIEDTLTLCLEPVAVADAEGYGIWASAVPLPDGVEDVGTRQEPNIDALLTADPDLVIVEASAADDPIIGQLEGYDIPVLATQGADAADPVDHMLGTFRLIAEATGRTERAEIVADEVEAGLDEAAEELADADLAGTEFVYLDGYLQGGNVTLRPFGQGSLVGEIGEALGLTNAWTGEVDEAYGLGQADIEGMTAIGDAMIFHTGTEVEDSDIIDELEQNPIWRSLPAVTEDRVHAFPVGIWTFGGPRSAQQIADAYVDVLTAG